tara:strand:- start:49 stop:528 length:480 start_codon:yes stop_codon:yes gene_type:complete
MEYRDVEGYEDLFSVSSEGNLLSKRTNKVLKLHTNRKGYVVCATKIGGRKGKNVCFRLHRLVALAFTPNPELKPEVNHIDGDKRNNFVCNLEWATRSENMVHASQTGLLTSRKGHFTLPEDQVSYIRSVYLKGSHIFGARALGREFGVCKNTITRYVTA